jgi:diguanylate cyclase (GGDEF)-like protein
MLTFLGSPERPLDQFIFFRDSTFTLLVGLVIGVAGSLLWERWALAKERALRETERGASDKAIARAKREIDELFRQNVEYGEVFQFLPDQIRELLIARGPRPVAPLALALVERLFHAEQAAVFVARPTRRALALVAGQGLPPQLRNGLEVPYGQGRIGYAAQAQATLDETDFATARGEETSKQLEKIQALEDPGLRGLKVDAAAPIRNGPELLGVLTVGGVRHRRGHEKKLLALVAELSAVAFLQSTRLKAAEEADRLDGLTGACNKRYLNERLAAELLEAERDQKPLSVLFFDLDYFEHYNRTNGHLAGDDLLRQLSTLMKGKIRDTDFLARVGGEEFVVVFPGANKETAMRLSEELRGDVEVFPFPHRAHQPPGAVTISGGVATFPEDSKKAESLLRCADQAVYEAKAAGRNRIFPAEPNFLT